jgi:hypothetical protein
MIFTVAGIYGIVAVPAVDLVLARPTDDIVVAVIAAQMVLSIAANNEIVAGRAIRGLLALGPSRSAGLNGQRNHGCP